MKIVVVLDDYTEIECNSILEAENEVLNAQAMGIGVDYVHEIDDGGNQIPMYCTWSVKLEKET